MSVSGDHPQKPTVARVVDSGLKSAAEMLKSLVSLLGDDLEAEERARIVSRLKTEARGLSARAISAMVCDLSQMVLQLRALYSQEVGIVLLEILSQAAALTVRLPSPKSLADPCMSILRVLEGVLLICTAQYAPTKVASVIEKLLRSRRLPWSATTRLEAAMFRLGEEGAYSGVPPPIPLSTSASHSGDDGGFEWLTEVASGLMPGAADMERIEKAKARIESAVRHVFPNSKPHFFGSSTNGFATQLSDIDCVVQLAPSDEAELLGGAGLATGDDSSGRVSHKARKIAAEKAAQVLSEAIRTKPELAESGLSVDELIVEARVPLVKCSSEEGVPIDVSFNNTLPLCNSRLLRCYSELDKRVVLLGCLVKTWAKKRCVNDAHSGTLSGYSYILLLIHYLQKIGFVPNLQMKEAIPEELHPKVGDTELVDGVHDVWFIDPKCAEAKVFMEAWAESKADDAHLHGLLAGFFRYFAYEFPIQSHAISIRHTFGEVLKTELFKDVVRKQALRHEEADALNEAPDDFVRPDPISVKEGPTDEVAACASSAHEATANGIGAFDGDAGVAGEDDASGGSNSSDEEEILTGGIIVDNTEEPAPAEQQEPDDGPPATPDLHVDRPCLSREEHNAQRLVSGRQVFCIEDPIESGRTLATSFNGAERLIYEMRRACQILKPGYGPQDWEHVLSGGPNPDCQLFKLLSHRNHVPSLLQASASAPRQQFVRRELYVPAARAGYIIGKSGAQIKDLQAMHDITRVTVTDHESGGATVGKSLVVIVGKTAEAVDACEEKISSLVGSVQNSSARSGPQSFYHSKVDPERDPDYDRGNPRTWKPSRRGVVQHGSDLYEPDPEPSRARGSAAPFANGEGAWRSRASPGVEVTPPRSAHNKISKTSKANGKGEISRGQAPVAREPQTWYGYDSQSSDGRGWNSPGGAKDWASASSSSAGQARSSKGWGRPQQAGRPAGGKRDGRDYMQRGWQ